MFLCFESNRAELVWDKNGIQVTSLPPGDENGVIELSVQSGLRREITLIVENNGTETIRLKNITLLWSVNFFDYSDISHIGLDKGNLIPGNRFLRFRCPASFPVCLSPRPQERGTTDGRGGGGDRGSVIFFCTWLTSKSDEFLKFISLL